MEFFLNTAMKLFEINSLYIDPTAITTSIVSASGIIIALGAASGAFMSVMTVAGAKMGAYLYKAFRSVYNAFCVVEHEGKEVEEDLRVK